MPEFQKAALYGISICIQYVKVDVLVHSLKCHLFIPFLWLNHLLYIFGCIIFIYKKLEPNRVTFLNSFQFYDQRKQDLKYVVHMTSR